MESGPGLRAAHRHGLDLRRAGHPHRVRRHRGRLAARARRKIRRLDGAGLCAGAARTCADELLAQLASAARAPSAPRAGIRRAGRPARGRRTAPHAKPSGAGRSRHERAIQTDRPALDDAIIVDEIGIESGVYGSYRLRSLLSADLRAPRPVCCAPSRSKGRLRRIVAGQEASRRACSWPPSRRTTALSSSAWVGAAICATIATSASIGSNSVVDLRPRQVGPEASLDRDPLAWPRELAEIGLDPGLVVCAIGEAAAVGTDAARVPCATRCAATACGSPIGDFGAGHCDADEQIDLLGPEIVRIDGGWFRQVCRDAATVRLFDARRLAACASAREGAGRRASRTSSSCGVALEAGADLFQGSASGAAGAGRRPSSTTRRFASPKSLARRRKIVPLFGRRRSDASQPLIDRAKKNRWKRAPRSAH